MEQHKDEYAAEYNKVFELEMHERELDIPIHSVAFNKNGTLWHFHTAIK